jgi:alkylation response protein AidB-like acyl-CoA dehydrogenase
MYFAHTEEQEEFRLSVRGFFDHHLPHVQLPTMLEREDVGAAFWTPMAQQLGLPGLAISEELGGSGYGMVELAIVLEEAGRALAPEPLFATLLGAAALELNAESEARAAILPQVAAGDLTLAVAMTDDEQNPAHANRGPNGEWRVSGTKIRVLAGQLADTLLVFADSAAGVALFAVESGHARIEPVRSLDVARPLATVRFEEAAGVLVGDGEDLAQTVGVLGALMLAAEQVGGAGRCLDVAVEYAKERQQFGRVIGSFQAVKHHCADMLVRYEAARTALMHAAWAWDDRADDRLLSAAVAKAAASDAYWDNARMCIQVLGGIGFTAEHPAQLHFKRATSAAALFGSAEAHREQITKQLADSMAVTA